jgi:hypothetical protein
MLLMSVTRVGATKKFADNWEHIFGGRKSKSSATAKPAKSAAKSAKKKSAAKKKPARGKKKARAGR